MGHDLHQRNVVEAEKIDTLYREALKFHLGHDFSAAEKIYHEILTLLPKHSQSNYMLGSMYLANKVLGKAKLHLQTAFDAEPENPLYQCALGRYFKCKQEFTQAEKFLEQSIATEGTPVEAFNELATLWIDKKEYDKALAVLEKGLTLFPQERAFLYNKSVVFSRQKKFAITIDILLSLLPREDIGVSLYFRLLKLYLDAQDIKNAVNICLLGVDKFPEDIVMLNETAKLYEAQHKLKEALVFYKKSLEIKPDQYDICNNIAGVYAAIGKNKEAIAMYQKSIELNDTDPRVMNNFANLLKRLHYHRDAYNYFEKALALSDDPAPIYNNFGSLLLEMGQQARSLACFEKAMALLPELQMSASNFLLASNYSCDDPEVSFKYHKDWGQKALQYKRDDNFVLPERKHKKIRIGFLSPDFRKHSVTYFLKPIFRHCPKDEFEIYAYSDARVLDDVAKALQSHSDHWQFVFQQDNDDLIDTLRADELDILFDLSGHTAKNRLLIFVNRLAPIQINYLGYPNTTGLTSMDYRMVDDFTDPPGSEKYATETLLRLPKSFLCYDALPDAPNIEPLPALSADKVTFGSFNNLAKLTPAVIAVWARLINHVENSHLFIKAKPLVDDVTKETYIELFEQAGLSRERLTLMGAIRETAGHLAAYHQVDIGLDTFPYHGTTTTCEALWMGVPVVTLAGNRHAARVGVSLLTHAGLPECIANSVEEYIDIAARLAGDINALAQLRLSLREKMKTSSLVDQPAFCSAFFNQLKKLAENL